MHSRYNNASLWELVPLEIPGKHQQGYLIDISLGLSKGYPKCQGSKVYLVQNFMRVCDTTILCDKPNSYWKDPGFQIQGSACKLSYKSVWNWVTRMCSQIV